MIDIADKLFPNLTTVAAQLVATGILYFLYRRYIHQPILRYLDRQAKDIEDAQNYSKKVKDEAQDRQQALEKEYQDQLDQLKKTKSAVEEDAERQRQEILDQAQKQKEDMLAQARSQISQEKAEAEEEAENHVIDLALLVSEKTLEGYQYDDDDLYKNLEKEVEQTYDEAN